MKHAAIILFVFLFLTATAFQGVTCSAQSSYTGTAVVVKGTDDITYELKYLYDKTGKKFAAEICLKNNTNKNFRVTWTLKGSLNTSIPAESGTKDIPAFTKVCIMTVFPIDPEKTWDPGVFHYDWEVIE